MLYEIINVRIAVKAKDERRDVNERIAAVLRQAVQDELIDGWEWGDDSQIVRAGSVTSAFEVTR